MRHSFNFLACNFLAFVLVLAFVGPCLYGRPQAGHSARLIGEVLSPTGKPVAGAVVTYQSGGGDTPHAVRTDVHGRFTIGKLRRDNYDLRASSHGLYSTWEKNVMVRSGQVKSVTLRLTNGAEAAKSSVVAPRQ
jgi:Carboxypeptidase regulatory-like domain